MLHELWEDPEPDAGGYLTFCLAGPMGDDARRGLSLSAQLVWSVEAESHFEAMTLYWERQGWGAYTTDFPEVDRQSYASRGWE
ncbi:hypothetical protein [Nocardioides sp. WS12]|uniref:hypothetical protein n=1 Tax=Nocardioides sp. WS12 TaxID=2486272 RepID=UPI0015FC0E5E|nr:hypothetical protein [Nocardioides sp. WS12]